MEYYHLPELTRVCKMLLSQAKQFWVTAQYVFYSRELTLIEDNCMSEKFSISVHTATCASK